MIALAPPISVTIVERCSVAPNGHRHDHSFEARAPDGAVLASERGAGPVGRMRALVALREAVQARGWVVAATELAEPFEDLEPLSVCNILDRLFFQGIVPKREHS